MGNEINDKCIGNASVLDKTNDVAPLELMKKGSTRYIGSSVKNNDSERVFIHVQRFAK